MPSHAVARIAVALVLSFFLVSRAGAAQGEDIVQSWDFSDPDTAFTWVNDCTPRVEAGVLSVRLTGPNPFFAFGEISVPTPVRLRMRLKLAGRNMFGVYWCTEESPEWGEDKTMDFPVAHDGEWHEVDWLLPARGRLTRLRLDPGQGVGTAEFDRVQLVRYELPEAVRTAMAGLPETVQLADETVSLTLRAREHAFELLEKRTGRIWVAEGGRADGPAGPAMDRALLVGAARSDPSRLELSLLDPGTLARFACTVALEGNGVVSFEIDAPDPAQPLGVLREYPPRFTSNLPQGHLLFCDRSCGVFIDQRDSIYRGRMLRVYGNTQCLDMPWIGLTDTGTGEGLMLLVETPCDALVRLIPDAEGTLWPQIRWEPSMGAFRYARRLSLRFSPSGGYVALAGMYRDIARREGKLVTLTEKAIRKPAVERLRGAPIVWGDMNGWEFVQEARAAGILHGIVANTRLPAEQMRMIHALGYITTEYDSYTDILEGDPGFQRDRVEAAAYRPSPGSGPMKGWQTLDGLQYYTRSSALARQAAATYVPPILEQHPFLGRFVDVSLAIDLVEDYHPEHTFDRRQDLLNRRAIFEYLDSLGLVLGTEHGNDWAIDKVEYLEGTDSGPFWWESNPNWNPGHLVRLTDREAMPENYRKHGISYDTRIPLWQLVYHDCAVTTWYWGDTAGFLHDVAPELADRKDLINILYGTVPLLWRSFAGYGWNRERERFLRTYHETCKFHEAVAFDVMTDHAFLSEDRALQRTRFSSGAVAVVNFSDEPRPYREDGVDLLLAPRGFYARGRGVRQSREWVDGEAVTRIEAPGYLRVETPSRRRIGPVEGEGLLTAFDLGDGRWHIMTSGGDSWRVDPAALTGAKGTSQVFEADEKGEIQEPFPVQWGGNEALLAVGPEPRILAVLTGVDPDEVRILPSRDTLGIEATVRLYVGNADVEIRYTTDGSEPTAESVLYRGPFLLPLGGGVKARAFSGDRPLASTRSAAFPRRTLFESGVIRVGDEAVPISTPLGGAARLRITVDPGDGTTAWDHADIGDAKLLRADGTEVFLSELVPVSAVQGFGVLQRDLSVNGKPLRIGGRTFARGLGTHAEADIVYNLDGACERFTARVGMDDEILEEAKDPKPNWGTATFRITAEFD